ncbi:terpenoid synthase [Penicillium frequentans]|nr:terpenoid synthase [Penicillium glabrum]
MATSFVETSTTKLGRLLSGQRVTIPNVLSLTPGWEPRLNINCQPDLKNSIVEWQQKYIASDDLRRTNQKVDVSLLSRSIAPEAELKGLSCVAKWCCWLFAYDDALDHNYFKGKDAEREIYRDEALRCAHHSLLDENGGDHDPAVVAPNYTLAQGLYTIGSEIRQAVQQPLLRELICESICRFIKVAVDGGATCNSGEILDLDSYFTNRMETSGVYPSLWITLSAIHINLPDWILGHELVKQLMHQTNIMSSLENDMLSFVKEIKHGHIESYVPILAHQKALGAQKAIDETAALIHTSYLNFGHLEDELLQLVPDEQKEETCRLIRACKDFRTGASSWHYKTSRYFAGLDNQVQAITVTLEDK